MKPGIVVYSYKGGQIQCRSQVDASGKISVLLESLKANTEITVTELYSYDNQKFFINIIMSVEQDTDCFKGWSENQEVSIGIDPIQIESVTLSGRIIFDSDQIIIMVPNNS